MDYGERPLTRSMSDARPSYSVRLDDFFTSMCSNWLVEAKMLSYIISFKEYTYMSSTANHGL